MVMQLRFIKLLIFDESYHPIIILAKHLIDIHDKAGEVIVTRDRGFNAQRLGDDSFVHIIVSFKSHQIVFVNLLADDTFVLL